MSTLTNTYPYITSSDSWVQLILEKCDKVILERSMTELTSHKPNYELGQGSPLACRSGNFQYNEHNVPVWPNEIFLYLSLNISCSLNLRVFIMPRSQLIFWNRLCVTSSICYRLPQHGGYWIDVASITAFVVFPPLEHGVRSEIPAKKHAYWSLEIKIELMMASFSGQGIDVILPCEDQLILGINNGRSMSKPVNKGRRDKTKKGMVSFKTMLQVAKNF